MFRRLGIPGSPCRKVNRCRLLVAAGLITVATVPNLLAYFHARAMMRYSSAGQRTQVPENLTLVSKVRVLATGVNLPRPMNKRTPQALGLDYSTHTIRGAGEPVLEVWRVPGKAARPVIVMFHGYSSCKSELLSAAKFFCELGCETILVDFRGSGGSGGNETTLGIHEAGDVARACEYARAAAPGRKLVLYGRSMGSAAVLRAIATGRLTPDGIIVECPFDRLLSTVENRFAAMRLPSFPMARLLVLWGGVQQGMNGFDHNPAEYAARVECPALVLHGERDVRVKISEVCSVYDRLAGDKDLILFPDAGHESYLEVDPDRWREAVKEFCARFPETDRND
jgi:alpha-beta hydrolase superfamily lysophospholipase